MPFGPLSRRAAICGWVLAVTWTSPTAVRADDFGDFLDGLLGPSRPAVDDRIAASATPYDAPGGGAANAAAPHDSAAALELRRAYLAIEEGRGRIAAERLEALLDRSPERVVLRADGRLAVVADEANALIARLPAADLARLRRLRGPVAADIVRDATRERRPDLLRVAAERFGFTEAGRRARNALGTRALDRGDFATARRLLEPLAGADLGEAFAEKLRFLAARGASADRPIDAGGGGLVPTADPREAGRTPLPAWSRAIGDAVGDASSEPGRTLPLPRPVLDGDRLFVPLGDRVAAFGVATGRVVWETAATSATRPRAGVTRSRPHGVVPPDSIPGRPEVGGGRLYVVERGRPPAVRRSNRPEAGAGPPDAIAAYDATNGSLLWRSVLGGSPDAPGRALTPPTFADGTLHLVVDRADDRSLIRLDAATGREVGVTLLAYEPPVEGRGGFRSRVFEDDDLGGVTVGRYAVFCPTGLGWLIAVDRETGRVRWGCRYLTANARSRWDDDASKAGWRPAAPSLSEQTVVFAPPESDSLFGVERATGRLAWVLARVQATEVGGVTGRVAAVVSPGGVAGYDLATGIPRWRAEFPGGAVASGAAALVENARPARLWVPLSTGEVVSVAMTDGAMTRGVIPSGGAAGRLVVTESHVAIQGGEAVRVFRRRVADVPLAEAKRLTPAERAARGRRALAGGDPAAAVAWVDVDRDPPADAAGRAVLRDALARLLSDDPTDRGRLARLRLLADGEDDRVRAEVLTLAAAADPRAGRAERREAVRIFLRLLGRADPYALVPGPGAGLRTALAPRLAGLLDEMRRRGVTVSDRAIAAAIAARAGARADARRLGRLFGLGPADPAGVDSRLDELDAWFQRHASRDADGRPLARPAVAVVDRPTSPAGRGDEWTRGVRVVRSSGAGEVPTAVVLGGAGAGGRPDLQWFHTRGVGRITAADRDGRTVVSFPFTPFARVGRRFVAASEPLIAAAVGDTLWLVGDGRLVGCDVAAGGPLSALPLPAGLAVSGRDDDRATRADDPFRFATPLGSPATLRPTDALPTPGLSVGGGGIAVLDGGTLRLLDPVTGRIRWERDGVDRDARLLVGETEVLTRGRGGTRFFATRDGAEVVPAGLDGRVVGSVASRWLTRRRDGDRYTLAAVDVVTGERGPDIAFGPTDRVGLLPGGTLVVLGEAIGTGGTLFTVDPLTGRAEKRGVIAGIADADRPVAFRTCGRLFVAEGGRRPSFLSVSAPAVPVDGTLACVDPAGGRIAWAAKVAGRVPIGLPTGSFAVPVMDGDVRRREGRSYGTLELTLLDPATGREIDDISVPRAVPGDIAAVLADGDALEIRSRTEGLRVEPIEVGLVPIPRVVRDLVAPAGG